MTDHRLAPLLFVRNLFLPADFGGNRYPYEVVRRLGERGHPTTVVTPRLHGQFPDLRNVRYRLYRVNRRHSAVTYATNVMGATLALRAEHRAAPGRTYAAALSGSYDSAEALRWSGLLDDVPLIFVYHGEFYSEWVQTLGVGPLAAVRALVHRYMQAAERRVFASCTRVVAVSPFSARQVAEREPSAAERTRVIPTGVDTAYFAPPARKDAAKRGVGEDPHRLLILGVGRLAGVKQFDRLVDGFALARASGGLDARLVIAGEGPERASLQRLIAARGLDAHVRLAGYCEPEALRRWMQAADLQVCSSAFENWSLAILEALACGTPVLGTPGGGTPDLVGQVDAALVLPSDTAQAIAEGMLRLTASPSRLSALGQKARTLAAERFDWERVVDRLEMLVAEVQIRP